MREVVLDTETTGLDPAEGHRIVEIGALELENHLPTGRVFHRYLDPERDVPAEAVAVHGLTAARLAKEPRFAAVAAPLLAFLGDARLVIHNAAFDIRFLDAELARLDLPPLGLARAIDTVAMARTRFPGAPASLDALCRRFGVDNSGRALHGALLDCQLLAEVYLELIGGRQPDLVGALAPKRPGGSAVRGPSAEGPPGPDDWRPPPRPAPLAPRLTEEDRARHAALVESLGPDSLWRRLDP